MLRPALARWERIKRVERGGGGGGYFKNLTQISCHFVCSLLFTLSYSLTGKKIITSTFKA